MPKSKILQVDSAAPKPSIWSRLKARVYKRIKRRDFAETYLAVAIVLLLVTTFVWLLLGARLNQSNADQLVDPYLFSSWNTFHTASFPGAHTFLLKWPIFALIGLVGVSPTTLLVATVAVGLVTVGAVAWLICRIERRPLVAGTLLLALASALLLVPAQPYAGGILPVSMAMLTTRNLEYVMYGVSAWCLVRSQRIASRYFVASVLLLAVLFASDKLFVSLSLAGALGGLIVYALAQKWRLVTLSVRWLVAGVCAGVLAVLILALINISGVTHIVNESSNSPYGFVHDAKNGAVAAFYAVLGIFTNFGANPAYDATQLAQVPRYAGRQLLSAAGPAYVVNIAIVVCGLLAVWRFAGASLQKKKPKNLKLDGAFELALLLLWSSIAALGVFVVTQHYYAVDARYLTIGLFSVFTATAVMARKRTWRPEWLVGMGIVLIIAIILGTVGSFAQHRASRQALQPYDERNDVIAQVLARHHVDTVVGDYWRVLPLRLASGNRQPITPLTSCTALKSGLSSDAWNVDLRTHSFAYMLSLDKSLTDFPRCNLQQVTSAYGTPNAAVLIAGKADSPKELLLFYDRGMHPNASSRVPQVVSTVSPIQLADMRNTSCEGPTTLSIVAHQDDDLLFMNPDQLHDIEAGHCVRTVYLTAGDGGHDKFYWLSREQGSEAAYDRMLGSKKGWLQQTVQLPGKQYLTVASPLASPKVSLLFFHLPDGNLTGSGFAGSNYESLERLFHGVAASMRSVDRQSTYTSSQLINGLEAIMNVYQPAQIRTQATVASTDFPDHSDHIATSLFVQKAYEQFVRSRSDTDAAIPLLHYVGYPVRDRPANVTGEDLAKKQAAFFAYAHFDGAVCYSMRDCSNTPTYWDYLARQYIQE